MDHSGPAAPADPPRVGSRVPLVGRDGELASLADALAGPARLISIVGPPGAGKTRLARAIAGAPGHATAWVAPLGEARGEADAVTMIGEALGLGPRERIGSALSGRRDPLLVLDDVEPVLDVLVHLVPQWLREAPGARVLATSRVRLGIEDRCVELGPLPATAAMELFLTRARRARDDFEPGADELPVVESLLARLDRLPLAIELAAARVAVLSPAQLLERLDAGLDVLRRAGHGRHSSLEQAIGVSWELLTAVERATLAQASVFCGGFSLAAAEAILRIDGPVIDALQALVEASLVQASEAGAGRELRFALFESVRSFAARERGDDAWLLERYAAYHVREGERLARACEGPDAVAALRHLALERENLLAAARHDDQRNPARAARTLLALHPLMVLRGPGTGDAPLLGRCAAAARRAGDPALLAAARLAQGAAAERHGQPAVAREAIDEAAALAAAAGERSLQGRAQLASGRLHFHHGELHAAEQTTTAAADIHAALGELYHEGSARNQLARIEEARGNLTEAARAFEEALALFRRCGSVRHQGICLLNIGVVRYAQGRLADARQLFEEALALHRAAGDRASAADNLVNLGSVHLTAGRLDDARGCLEAALAQERELGNRRFEGLALGNLALVDHLRGDLAAARDRYQQALAVLRECGDRQFQAVFLAFSAAAEAALGLLPEARRDLGEARTMLGGFGDPAGAPLVDVLEGFLDIAGGDLAGARARRARAERLRRDGGTRDSELPVALRLLGSALAGGAELRVEPGARRFQVGAGPVVDLSRRGSLRRILARLVDHRLSEPGAGLDVDDLFASGWPGQRADPTSAAARVYTAVRTLRRMGLEDILVREEDGYRIDAAVKTDYGSSH